MPKMYSVLRALKKKNVFANLTVKSKNELLNVLISSFEGDVSETELQAIKRAINKREEAISTGIGNGLAIPHGKSDGIACQHVALAVLKEPVEYNSFDDKPVSVTFLFAGPKSEKSSHINLMSEVSKLMNDEGFSQKLKEHRTREDLYCFLKDYEQMC